MTPLTPEQLAYVITHGELLLLLSLQRLEAMLETDVAPPPPTTEELAAAEAFAQAELQRLERLWLDQSTNGTPLDEDEQLVILPAVPGSTNNATLTVDIAPEIETALVKAYADIPARAQRLQRIDTGSLAPALAAITPTLPSLTQPLDVQGLSVWLDLHDAGDTALNALMAQARALGGTAG